MKKIKQTASHVDLKKYYTIFLEIGIISSLLIFIIATNIRFTPESDDRGPVISEQEIVKMEDIVKTEQPERPPAPPRPQVPVEVANSVIIEEDVLNFDAEYDFSEPMDIPPPPKEITMKEEDKEEDFFVAVEQMPKLIGSLADLQKQIEYPKKATLANIEGRVVVQFIINEQGEVEDPRVIRGIGGGCDEEAIRVTKLAKFEPGRQRGRRVRVQFSLPFNFILKQ